MTNLPILWPYKKYYCILTKKVCSVWKSANNENVDFLATTVTKHWLVYTN